LATQLARRLIDKAPSSTKLPGAKVITIADGDKLEVFMFGEPDRALAVAHVSKVLAKGLSVSVRGTRYWINDYIMPGEDTGHMRWHPTRDLVRHRLSVCVGRKRRVHCIDDGEYWGSWQDD